MIELPNDVEYQRLSRAVAAPVRPRAPDPVPALPVDTDPPPGWLPTPESRAAMDALLPPMRAESEPVASPGALAVADAADAQLDIPMRARTMLARRLHRYGAILDDPESTAADVVAVGRALAHLGGLGDGQTGGGGLTVNVGVWTHAQKISRIEKIIQLGKNRSLMLADRSDGDDGGPVGK